jgi:hypothetical protein
MGDDRMSTYVGTLEAVVRGAIRNALQEFAANPFYDLRERDLQAHLLHTLRSTLQPPVVAAHLRTKKDGALVAPPVSTSRVHAEMKIGAAPIDLIVLRADHEPELTVYHHAGALDVVASVRREDVSALIEVKAAPSSRTDQIQAFIQDLQKLSRLTAGPEHCLGFFVLCDKSLRLGSRTAAAGPRFDWLDCLHEDESGRVEAHWLDEQGVPQVRRGHVR